MRKFLLFIIIAPTALAMPPKKKGARLTHTGWASDADKEGKAKELLNFARRNAEKTADLSGEPLPEHLKSIEDYTQWSNAKNNEWCHSVPYPRYPLLCFYNNLRESIMRTMGKYDFEYTPAKSLWRGAHKDDQSRLGQALTAFFDGLSKDMESFAHGVTAAVTRNFRQILEEKLSLSDFESEIKPLHQKRDKKFQERVRECFGSALIPEKSQTTYISTIQTGIDAFCSIRTKNLFHFITTLTEKEKEEASEKARPSEIVVNRLKCLFYEKDFPQPLAEEEKPLPFKKDFYKEQLKDVIKGEKDGEVKEKATSLYQSLDHLKEKAMSSLEEAFLFYTYSHKRRADEESYAYRRKKILDALEKDVAKEIEGFDDGLDPGNFDLQLRYFALLDELKTEILESVKQGSSLTEDQDRVKSSSGKFEEKKEEELVKPLAKGEPSEDLEKMTGQLKGMKISEEAE